MEKYKLINNKLSGRYEYQIGKYSPHLEYKVKDNDIYLTHTRVPEDLRGQGIGKMLAKDVLEDISKQDRKIVPLCGFVATYIRKNPEWKRLLKQGIQIG